MSRKKGKHERERKRLAIRVREQLRCLDPANVLEDVVWKYAPDNGNPIPKAKCGSRHRGSCCGCDPDTCCY